jgi:hypothetical protein
MVKLKELMADPDLVGEVYSKGGDVYYFIELY